MCSNLYCLFSKRIDLSSDKFFYSSAYASLVLNGQVELSLVEKNLFFKLSVRLFVFSNKEVDFS